MRGVVISARTIRAVRKKLDLNSFAFAAIMGVHTSTVYRWEKSRSATVSVDMLQAEVLTRLMTLPATTLRKAGVAASRGLAAHGMVGGLAAILAAITRSSK